MIKEIRVNSMPELTHELNVLPNHYAFRGQSNSIWSLQSTLERILGDKWSEKLARQFEDYSLEVFKSKYHIYSATEHVPNSKFGWLSVMQHYGVPTRLIDFTTSPYIALYFALETYDPLSNNDLAIYALDYTSIMECSLSSIRTIDNKFIDTRKTIQGKQDQVFDEVVDRYSYDIAWITEPVELNARIDRQSGTFLIAGNLGKTIEKILNLPLYSQSSIIKIIIPALLYEGIFVALRKMSINSKSIYGDLAGLARSIRMELHSYITN